MTQDPSPIGAVLVSHKSISHKSFIYFLVGCSEYQDIVFSIDRSLSIGPEILEAAFEAVRNVIGSLDQDQNNGGQKEKVRVGVQTFNLNQQVVQHLNVVAPLGDSPTPDGGTDIIGALA